MRSDAMLDERQFLLQAADGLHIEVTRTFGPETIEGVASDSLTRLSDGVSITKERLMAAGWLQHLAGDRSPSSRAARLSPSRSTPLQSV